MATTSHRSNLTPCATAPSAIPCISSRYSWSIFGHIISSAALRKNSQSFAVSWTVSAFSTCRVSSISGASRYPCWKPISAGVPCRWTKVQPFLAGRRLAFLSRASLAGLLDSAANTRTSTVHTIKSERRMFFSVKFRLEIAGYRTRSNLSSTNRHLQFKPNVAHFGAHGWSTSTDRLRRREAARLHHLVRLGSPLAGSARQEHPTKWAALRLSPPSARRRRWRQHLPCRRDDALECLEQYSSSIPYGLRPGPLVRMGADGVADRP